MQTEAVVGGYEVLVTDFGAHAQRVAHPVEGHPNAHEETEEGSHRHHEGSMHEVGSWAGLLEVH